MDLNFYFKPFNELMPSFLYFLNYGVLDLFLKKKIYSTQLSLLLSGGVVGVPLCYNSFPSPLCVFVFQKKKKINLYIYNLVLKQNIIITIH